MEKVTVNKAELLETLLANREAHKGIFEEAVAGYKQECIKQLEQHLERVKSGKVFQVVVNLPVPQEHTKDYDRAIKMVQMEVGENIVMDEISFGNYVMDDWQWKRQFLTSNSAYSAGATAALNKI